MPSSSQFRQGHLEASIELAPLARGRNSTWPRPASALRVAQK